MRVLRTNAIHKTITENDLSTININKGIHFLIHQHDRQQKSTMC